MFSTVYLVFSFLFFLETNYASKRFTISQLTVWICHFSRLHYSCYQYINITENENCEIVSSSLQVGPNTVLCPDVYPVDLQSAAVCGLQIWINLCVGACWVTKSWLAWKGDNSFFIYWEDMRLVLKELIMFLRSSFRNRIVLISGKFQVLKSSYTCAQN